MPIHFRGCIMCGIVFSLTQDPYQLNTETQTKLGTEWTDLIEASKARGPDSQRSHTFCPIPSSPFSLSFFTSVLHLRGPSTHPQPVVSSSPSTDSTPGDVLCWNGQVFESSHPSLDGEALKTESDTATVWRLLRKEGGNLDGVRGVLGGLEGPWASIYYNASTQTLYISRDPLGRRSLLISRPTLARPRLLIASVASAKGLEEAEWEELSCQEIHTISLAEDGMCLSSSELIQSHPRHPPAFSSSASPSIPRPFTLHGINRTMPPSSTLAPLSSPSSYPCSSQDPDHPDLPVAADELIVALAESVRLRVENIPSPAMAGDARLGVLFSGGIDCTVVALLASRYIPLSEPIDLLNVAFENPRALQNMEEQRRLAIRNGKKREKERKRVEEAVALTAKWKEIKSGKDASVDGARRGMEHMPMQGEGKAGAEEKPEWEDKESEEVKRERMYGVPDRLTGRAAVEELRRLCPERTWDFVEIDVPYIETARLTPQILSLMYPSGTIMDLSLALALYFASRGAGTLSALGPSISSRRPYQSPAKVLLSGLGADEQLGGYARHRRAWENGKWEGVIDEIQLDLTRLPTRNLSRDDRITSSHSLEVRYPFLSLSFLAHTSALPIHLKMDFRYPDPISHDKEEGQGEEAKGDKMILRVAAGRLGLEGARGRKKRAMQFGARSARLEVER